MRDYCERFVFDKSKTGKSEARTFIDSANNWYSQTEVKLFKFNELNWFELKERTKIFIELNWMMEYAYIYKSIWQSKISFVFLIGHNKYRMKHGERKGEKQLKRERAWEMRFSCSSMNRFNLNQLELARNEFIWPQHLVCI